MVDEAGRAASSGDFKMKSSLVAQIAILHRWDARETVNESEAVGDRSRCDVIGLRCGHGDSIAASPSHVQASDGTAVGGR